MAVDEFCVGPDMGSAVGMVPKISTVPNYRYYFILKSTIFIRNIAFINIYGGTLVRMPKFEYVLSSLK